MLAIAYSAGIGGTGTLTGTATNLIFKAIVDEYVTPSSLIPSFTHAFNVVTHILSWRLYEFVDLKPYCRCFLFSLRKEAGISQWMLLEFMWMFRLYGSKSGINYGTWLAFNVPGLLVNVFLACFWLQGIFLFKQ